MESLAERDGFCIVGGQQAVRFQDARYRLINDDFYVPLAELVAISMDKLKTDDRIARLYSQSSGLTYFLMFADEGRRRDALVDYLVAIYTGRDRTSTLAELTGEKYEALDQQYRDVHGRRRSLTRRRKTIARPRELPLMEYAARPWKLAETNYGYREGTALRSGGAAAGGDRAAQPAPALRHRHARRRTSSARRSARRPHARGAKVVLLPTIPYGTRDQPDGVSAGDEPQSVDAGRGDRRPGRFAGAARHPQDRALNSHGGNDLKPVLRELYGQTPAQLFLCNWYRVLADVERRDFRRRRATTPARWKRRSSWPIIRDLVARRPGRHAGGRRRRDGRDAVRGGQSRLGFDHAALAPADDQLRRRQSARRHGREGPADDGAARRAAGRPSWSNFPPPRSMSDSRTETGRRFSPPIDRAITRREGSFSLRSTAVESRIMSCRCRRNLSALERVFKFDLRVPGGVT